MAEKLHTNGFNEEHGIEKKSKQPEFANMPRLPKVDEAGRLYLDQRADMNSAWDQADEDLKKTGQEILGLMQEGKIASYRVTDVDGNQKVFERIEGGAKLHVRKAGKQGAGRPLKAKA